MRKVPYDLARRFMIAYMRFQGWDVQYEPEYRLVHRKSGLIARDAYEMDQISKVFG